MSIRDYPEVLALLALLAGFEIEMMNEEEKDDPPDDVRPPGGGDAAADE